MVRRDLYSVTRRFDLATMLAGMTAFALLFGGMRALSAPPSLIGFVAGLVATVAAAQALLFGGYDPRRASILSGWAYCAATPIVLSVLAAWAGQRLDVAPLYIGCTSMTGLLLGGVAGYFAGALAAGVFLVSEAIRDWLPWLLSPFSPQRPQGDVQSPWDDDEP